MMPFMLKDLVVDRVDLVDEGANSAAFIELYKRKELRDMDMDEIVAKLKPEHADVIKNAIAALETSASDAKKALDEANEVIKNKDTEIAALKSKACNGDGEGNGDDAGKACGEAEKNKGGVDGLDEEEVLKSMPDSVKEAYAKMKAQKEAAEEIIRKNAEEQATNEAVAKAASLKALPVEQAKLVEVLKSANTDVIDMLTAINTAIEGTVLDEVGKSAGNGAGKTATDAWSKIEAKADEVAKRDSVTKQKAIAIVLKEEPELYKE